MTDTAQLAGAAETDPNAQLGNAADAFKAFLSPAQPRNEVGQFASAEQPEETADEAEPEALLAEGEADEGEGDEQQAAEEAQPMPPSWPADQAEHWSQLPAETQAFIASREAERDRGLNLKMQESANARKAAEAARDEANANRTKYADQLDTLLGAIQPVKPDPRAYGLGTGQYHQEAYELAKVEYEQQAEAIAQLNEQRDAIRTAEKAEQENSFQAWRQEQEAEYAPKFIADVPELTDPVKADPAMRGLIDYAIKSGIPADTFAEENQSRIMSAELHVLWKAMQFDKLRDSRQEPKPKPAGPAVKPGVSSPRSAQKAATRQRNFDRLSREGSIEAGAAVFKDIFRK
jgi:hypothetical protein